MKLVLTLSTLILFFSAYSQVSANSFSKEDSSVNCIANWKLGDTKIYGIVHEKNSIDANGKTVPFKFAYEAWVSVIDSSAKNYTIKWVFHLPAEVAIFRPGLADSLPVYNGMQMIFRIIEMGAFVELMNWEEVRDAFSKMMELSLPKKMDSTRAAIVKSAKDMYNSKAMVESSMIQEIQLFHAPYGYKFSTQEAAARTEFSNPFGGDPLPAKQTSRVTELDPKKDVFALAINMSADKANTKSIIDALLKKMNIKDDQEMREAREKYASFDIRDFSEYHFNKSSGWISSLYYKRTIFIAGVTQSDSYNITLKE
jgi:hypothetical protein